MEWGPILKPPLRSQSFCYQGAPLGTGGLARRQCPSLLLAECMHHRTKALGHVISSQPLQSHGLPSIMSKVTELAQSQFPHLQKEGAPGWAEQRRQALDITKPRGQYHTLSPGPQHTFVWASASMPPVLFPLVCSDSHKLSEKAPWECTRSLENQQQRASVHRSVCKNPQHEPPSASLQA